MAASAAKQELSQPCELQAPIAECLARLDAVEVRLSGCVAAAQFDEFRLQLADEREFREASASMLQTRLVALERELASTEERLRTQLDDGLRQARQDKSERESNADLGFANRIEALKVQSEELVSR